MRKISGKICAALLSALLLSATIAAAAGAYFSDYETALGEVTLNLSGQTRIDEEVNEGEKTISITNTGDATVVVRLAVYGPGKMTVEFDDADWEKNGDYYYYKKVLAPNETTSSAVTATMELTDEEKEMIGDSFDIVVVHESATAVYEFDEAKQKNKVMVPVTYDENNNETSWGHIPDIWVD